MDRKFILIMLLMGLLFAGCEDKQIIYKELDVSKSDMTTQHLNLFLSQKIDDLVLLENLTRGQDIINISTNTTPQVGEFVCLKDIDGNAFTQEEIESVTPLGGTNYQVKLHSGVDFSYTTEDGCSLRTINMAVDGSVTEQVFTISSLGLNENVKWDITRIICVALGDGVGAGNDEPDGSSFLTTGANNDGIYLRLRNGEFYKNIFHATTNAEIQNNLYDLQISPANRLGLYQTTFRLTWNGDDKSGVVLRLSSNESDTNYHYFDMVIQRDLTDLTSFTCKLQGHETDDYIKKITPQEGNIIWI